MRCYVSNVAKNYGGNGQSITQREVSNHLANYSLGTLRTAQQLLAAAVAHACAVANCSLLAQLTTLAPPDGDGIFRFEEEEDTSSYCSVDTTRCVPQTAGSLVHRHCSLVLSIVNENRA